MEEESSEMRRQRLRALRMDADGASAPSPSSPLPRLFNPLLHDPPFSSPGIDSTPPSSRFDYYTDPMSAFSGSKRKGAFPPYNTGFSSSPVSRPPPPSPSSGGPRNFQMAASHAPAQQFQVNQSPNQNLQMHYPPHTPMNQSPNQNLQMHYPPHTPIQQFHVNQSPNQSSQIYYPPGGSWRHPGQFGAPCSGYRGSPNSSVPRGPTYNSGGGFTSPTWGSSGRGRNPMGYSGRGSFHSNHESRHRNSLSPGWSHGGRGPGGSSAQQETGQLYNKSMLVDPWQNLKPVVGNILVPLAGPDFWLPKSLQAKKAKVVESGTETSNNSHQSSLAEYLALSLEEAINNATDVQD
ncbi:protein SICKLE [Dioscorea cayenensis subsp. rotundata]|uniref:Protein SICKLE n=1 Tax=Dioscorea cayennensis subsp. rotundata TaxID=55577 RepID=A0AB40B5B4_DIOCR|nr:protein SICKLE [Dioscorea cayenensis subsp. rotundata]